MWFSLVQLDLFACANWQQDQGNEIQEEKTCGVQMKKQTSMQRTGPGFAVCSVKVKITRRIQDAR